MNSSSARNQVLKQHKALRQAYGCLPHEAISSGLRGDAKPTDHFSHKLYLLSRRIDDLDRLQELLYTQAEARCVKGGKSGAKHGT